MNVQATFVIHKESDTVNVIECDGIGQQSAWAIYMTDCLLSSEHIGSSPLSANLHLMCLFSLLYGIVTWSFSIVFSKPTLTTNMAVITVSWTRWWMQNHSKQNICDERYLFLTATWLFRWIEEELICLWKDGSQLHVSIIILVRLLANRAPHSHRRKCFPKGNKWPVFVFFLVGSGLPHTLHTRTHTHIYTVSQK